MADRYSPHQIPLAIVGMACRLPGADNLEQYWQMLVGGGHAVAEMPADRFDEDMYYDPEVGVRGKTYSKLAATLSSRAVDLNGLPIDPKLAASVDAAHLIMCDVAAAALRHAGMDPFNVPLRNTGVYVGHAQGTTLAGDHTYSTCMAEAAEFLRQVPAFQQLPPHEQQAVIDELIQRVRAPLPHPTVETPDVSASLVAGAINKAFGLNGPYVAINSACASSLQAMLLGARQLQLGRVDMAIVGGASDCKSDSLVLFSNARAMSATGTRPFDADADGLIVGEGYVAVVMKTLKRALDDGDKVFAVVRGLGVSSDGKGKSLWAPRKEGQTKAMERAYRDGLDVADLDYVEAHATATKLGDATELNTLKGILGAAFPPEKKIPITSVKANIGHTLETAGIAGVIKAVLAINNETVPPAINIKEINPNIDWANSPVYVPTAAQPWPKRADGKPRRAGCNAFGIGGLNMHVAVDEYLESSRALAAAMPGPPQDLLSADEQAIAVIGLGCVLPGAENPTAFWNLLSGGVDPKGPIPADRWNPAVAIRAAQGAAPDPNSLVGGFIHGFEYDWKRHKVPPKQVQQADPLQFMLLEASDQAMKDAGYDAKPFNRENVGVVVGTEFGGDFSFQLQLGLRIPELERHIEALLTKRGFTVENAKQTGKDYAEAMLKAWPALIDETGSFSTSSLASRIGKTWNLMGGAAAIDAGQSSGLAALSISVDMLLARDCDMMICAAGQRRMGWPMYESLALSGDLAQGSPRSPLDAAAAGCVPGEGVVVLLLKRLKDAQRDGDRIHAILHGVGAAHDHNSWGKALELAMERSFGPNAKPADVAVMELDALSDPATTAEEIRAVASVHGRDGRQHPLMISSVLGQLGNTQGASSLVSMLKAILEVSHGELPPPVGMQSPATAIKQQDGLLAAPTARTAIDYTTADGRRLAAVGTCSRGLAYHAVLEYGSRVEVKRPGAAAAPQAQPAVAAAPASSSVNMAELEAFLVNFVVEQTGYPPEVVELDADLEADLGIDSIKKAQMFGELQEYFDVTPTEGLTLDDFPTLRHIVNFLAKAPTKAGAPVTTTASAPQAAAAPVPAPAPAAFNGAGTYSNGAAATPVAAASPSAQTSEAPAASVDMAELEKFLVNFVVEQTGYPPEVVELDADLEADLGIDSIKKAQMFGELQEYFDVTPTEGLTLDDFPTLRHIVNFLAKAPTKAGAPVTTAASAPQPAVAPQPAPAIAVAPAPVAAPPQPQAAPASAAPAVAASSQWQICRFGAADPVMLRALATGAQSDPNAFTAASQRKFAAGDRFRLAIVADNVSTLTSRLATALKQLDNPASQTVLEQQGIFYREANPNTRIAFLFPGQGSQYAGMLKQLVADVPAVARQQAEIDITMRGLGFPSWPTLAWDESSPLGKDVWTTQISMLLADVLMLAALRERGIEPDLVAGHSYGEYPALFAAGAWNLEQAIRVTRRRCESIDAQPGGQTGMLATTATPEMIDSLTPRLSGPAYVANHNAPDQTVVGGTLPALAELEAMLQQSLFETRKLQVPSAFHTPLMRPAGEMFQRAIAGETFTQPRVTTYSVANNEIVREPSEIGHNLVAHLTTPVRYADLVRKLAAQAPTVFVEVGPQQALTRLNRRILPPQELAGIACDNPSRPGIEQVVRVQAMLECSGALDRQRGQQPAAVPAAAAAPQKQGQIFHFDATARRRDKMRAAATKTAPAARPAPQVSAASPKPVAPPATVAPPVAATPIAPAPQPVAAPAPAPAPVVSAAKPSAPAPAPAAAQPAPSVDMAELEKFLVNFVVEQTGYPPEVVELDADLEADLGIDSIKKAQMFGELQEYFDVTPTEGLTLDDFPTLRHIVNFLAKAPTKAGAPVTTAASAPQPAAPAPAPAPVAAPAPIAAAPAPQAEVIVPTATQPTPGVDTAELEAFLVNFVVEQTGYPPEVVELDADLEADLGIDSIKKAQMFGELQEYFDVTPTDGLTLDDFPTLRHIVNFLAKAPTKAGAPVTTSAPAADAPTADTAAAAGIAASSSAQVDVLHVRGTAYELGFQHGAEKKTEIRRLLRRIADLTDGNWSELPIPAEARNNPERYFTPAQLEELRGLADAVEVPLGNLAALNLAVLPDFAASAAQVALVTNSAGKTQVLNGLAGELSLPPALAEMLSPLVLVREPDHGWACATVTFAGIIGSLVGLNGNGLAASTGTLVDTTAATNGSASSMAIRVDGILQRSGSIEHASRGLQQTHATRGWTACLSDQSAGRLAAAEHDGRNYLEQPSADLVIAANHCVLGASSQAMPEASLARFNWLRGHLNSGQQPQDAGQLLSLLGEVPGGGSLKLAAVVDAARGDLLIECGSIRQRVHIGALLPSTPAGDPSTWVAPTPAASPTSSDLQEPAAVDPDSMRFVLRIVPTPWETQPADFPTWKGIVAIQGSKALADALANRISASGATVVRLRESTSTEAALAELESLWQQQPVTHLFLTSLRDETPFDRSNPADFAKIYEQRVMLPYFLCQKQMHLAGDAKRITDCTVVAALNLGGDLGFSGGVAAPESGFCTGLMKSLLLEYQIMREQKGFLAKAIDAPADESPDELAANICRELAYGTNDYELSFVGGQRYLQVALPVAAKIEEVSGVQPSSVWVLTGGARGITAECGMTLAKRFGLKLHLIGTTPAGAIDPSWRDLDEKQTAALKGQVIIEARKNGQKPNEAWARVEKAIEIHRNLRAFTAAGVSSTYHACDVSNREALAQVLDAVRRQDGPISGILHGAGIEQSCRYEKKTPQSVRATVGSKALGAYHLMSLTQSDPITHFIGFGSISGRLGSNGQTDYSAASDMLCKLMSWYRQQRPEVHAVGFHFHPWDGVGMAARPDTEAILKASNLRLMPMQTGIQHLLRELYSKSAETELMITDYEYHQRYYGNGVRETAKRNDLLGAPGQPLPTATRAASPAKPVGSATKSPVKRIADRTLMRMVDAPLAGAAKPLPQAVVLLGNNVGADALAQTLASRGVRVDRLTQLADHAAACAEVEQLLEANPSRCLIVATARDPQATQIGDRASAQQRTERGIYLPYWVIRRWYQIVSKTPEAGQATIVALTSLGGDFGFAGPVPAPEGGAFTGLLKSIFVEDGRYDHTRFRVKVIDAPADEPATQLADSVCRELAGDAPEVEVAWSGGRRQVVKVSREPVEQLPLGELPRGGVWVVTGGARGITAATAIELGRRYGLKLHLLGKSPAPEVNPPWRNCSDEQLKAIKADIVRKATQEGRSPTDDWDRVRKDREIQESLDKFTAAGLTATYHQCDVADWDDVDRVLKNVRAADGPISGIVHGAGYAKSFRFGTGVGNKLEATIAPKVDGTLALMQLTANDPIKYFVGFGSLSGRFGGNGLSDYAAANDALAKLCGWYRGKRPECHTVCFHWQTWDAVGMALLADGVGITKNAFKMDFISPEEGVNHLIDELRAGTPESEVLITDGFFQRQFYPFEMEIAPQSTASEPTTPATGEPTSYGPLIAAWEPKSVASGTARIKFDPEADPFLSEHRLRQKPFLPGVVGLESLAEAARCALGRDTVMEIRNARITNGMSFPSGPLEARVEVTPVDGGLKCRLLTEQRDRKGRLIDANRLHVEGIVPAGVDSSPLVCDPPGRPPLGWFPHQYPEDGLMYHGRGLRYLTGCAYQFDGGWGQITAPDLAELAGPRGGEGWTVPISVLDACVVACGGYLFMQFGGVIEVPYEFERLRIARLPRTGEACVIRLFFRERGEKYSRFDFTLFGEGDEPLLQVDGYRTIRVGGR